MYILVFSNFSGNTEHYYELRNKQGSLLTVFMYVDISFITHGNSYIIPTPQKYIQHLFQSPCHSIELVDISQCTVTCT